MPLRYLLDTNVISKLVRQPSAQLMSRISAVGEDAICTSIVVAAELRYGARKATSSKLKDRVEMLLSALEVLALEPPADRVYGELRYYLAKQGTLIGANDLLIAAHTIAADLTLITANIEEFERVPGLRMENWLLE